MLRSAFLCALLAGAPLLVAAAGCTSEKVVPNTAGRSTEWKPGGQFVDPATGQTNPDGAKPLIPPGAEPRKEGPKKEKDKDEKEQK